MVPALATGWDDVKKRSDLQEQLAASHQARMSVSAAAHPQTSCAHHQECSKALQTITRQTSHDSTHRLQELQRRLTTLQQRLIHVAGESLSLNPHFASTSYKPEEAQTKAKLLAIKDELDGNTKSATTPAKSSYGLHESAQTPTRRKNAGEGRLSGQVNELWGSVEDIRRKRKMSSANGGDAWSTDEKALETVAQVSRREQDWGEGKNILMG
jgi:nuclear pore complex protein Nup54